MTKRYFLILIVFTSFIFNGCETDFSLNADYQVTPVVFGLLDHNESIHYVKITRTFLGDGNNYEFAKEPDSNYFHTVDAKIIEYEKVVSGEPDTKTGKEWQLHDTIIPNKESGTFYAPNQKVYVFYTDSLKEDKVYQLVADLDEGKYQIKAFTTMMNGYKHPATLQQPGFKFGFATANSTESGNYGSQPIQYTPAKNAALYKFKLRFWWRETYSNGTTQDFSIDWVKDNITVEKPETPPPSSTFLFSGGEFYQVLKASISQDNAVTKREFLKIDFIVTMAHAELAKYMEVSKPSSSIAQTKPLYTNVHNGLGLFSSRHTASLNNLTLNTGSIEELCRGQYTGLLGFCSNLPEHSTKNFYCD